MLEDTIFFIIALALSPVFIGGTISILFSKLASWKTRRYWVGWSMLAPVATVIIVLILWQLRWWDTAAGTRLGLGAIFITPLANWLTYKSFKARNSGAPVVTTATASPTSPQPRRPLFTLAWIVFAIGLYLSVRGVFFAVEMFYGGPWVDSFSAHYMGIAAVLFGAAILSDVGMLYRSDYFQFYDEAERTDWRYYIARQRLFVSAATDVACVVKS